MKNWFDNIRIYHLLIDRFNGGWQTPPASENVFCGGNLQGVTDKLDYIKDLAPELQEKARACGSTEELLALAKEQYPSLNGRVYAIENDFFGHTITVSGLITGQDLVAQLKGKALGERLFISQNMLRRQEMDFLDDMTLSQAVEALGVPIYPNESDGFVLWDAISGDALPEVRLPEQGEATAYYRYNQNP